MFLQIKVMNREFLSNSHSSLDNAAIQSNLSEITISEPTQRHDKYAIQLVSDCNGDNEWCVLQGGTSVVTDTLLYHKNQT